ncbi:cystatin-B-like [Pelobates cultripes]|uniref:Cystatin-B-like n=1 Tax=Pelobates cultripes TaxID=61616 RepID=A0AAD1QYI5_PELCU|nr:cystatin-B-like [Pelobates cultripes]
MPLCGGLGEAIPATPEIQELCDKVKAQAEAKSGKNFGQFIAVSYKTQVVAGKNLFIKVDAGDSFLHVRVYQALPHTNKGPEVHSVQIKSKDDEIDFF